MPCHESQPRPWVGVQTVRDGAIPLSLNAAGREGDTMSFLDQARADWGEW
jgi:hypothetical protein